jgi:tetratricopeptide (TPR) repeat protein
MSINNLQEELDYLVQAVEGDTFHFVVVQWSHYSQLQKVKEHLNLYFPERESTTLVLKSITYEEIIDKISIHHTGFVFIDDFEEFIQNKDISVAFNQRRGSISQLPLCIVAFVLPGSQYINELSKALPDWWSIITFLAIIQEDYNATGLQLAFARLPEKYITSLGGQSYKDRIKEVQKIMDNIHKVEKSPENSKLLNELYRQVIKISMYENNYKYGLEIMNQWLNTGKKLNYKKVLPEVYSEILENFGIIEETQENYSKAKFYFDKALRFDKKIFGVNHPLVAKDESNLAKILIKNGKLKESRKKLENALLINIKNFELGDPIIYLNLFNLGTVYLNLGLINSESNLINSAINLFTASLNACIKLYGLSHTNVSDLKSKLSFEYLKLGFLGKAKDLLEEALVSDLKTYGSGHPLVAIRRCDLANVYQILGQFEQAIILLKISLDSELENLGPTHPVITVIKHNLAVLYNAIADYNNSIFLLKVVVASDKKHYGLNHPNIAVDYSNLATVYLNMGEKSKSYYYYKKAFKMNCDILGIDHPKTQNTKARLKIIKH